MVASVKITFLSLCPIYYSSIVPSLLISLVFIPTEEQLLRSLQGDVKQHISVLHDSSAVPFIEKTAYIKLARSLEAACWL
jgi:hypothetical protein